MNGVPEMPKYTTARTITHTHTHACTHKLTHVDMAVWKLGQEAPKQVKAVRGGLLRDLNEPSGAHQGGEGRGARGGESVSERRLQVPECRTTE